MIIYPLFRMADFYAREKGGLDQLVALHEGEGTKCLPGISPG